MQGKLHISKMEVFPLFPLLDKAPWIAVEWLQLPFLSHVVTLNRICIGQPKRTINIRR